MTMILGGSGFREFPEGFKCVSESSGRFQEYSDILPGGLRGISRCLRSVSVSSQEVSEGTWRSQW